MRRSVWFSLVVATAALFLGLVSLDSLAVRTDPLVPLKAEPYETHLLAKLRQAATAVPGALPTAVNYTKFAESHRIYADVIEGGSNEPFVSGRTAFQVAYPDGWVMIDAGMDRQVHRFFGGGKEEPFWQDQYGTVQQALKSAKLILITHEHGDHVAGVIRTEVRAEIAPKTLLTKDQVRTLILAPQLPELRLTPETARDYLVVDYETYYPVAPGIVLVKSPGHTHGHQIIYVRLDSGKEYLFIGDIGWTIENVLQQKLRPQSQIDRIKEDPEALRQQLRWIKQVMDQEGLIVVPCHDDKLLKDYAEQRLLGSELTLP